MRFRESICVVTLGLTLLGRLSVGLNPARAGDLPASMPLLSHPPTIDGKTADWAPNPPAGQQMTGPDGAISFSLGYDATNFYALIQVADKSPLRNGAARAEEMMKGGDGIAFYFGGEPGREQRVLAARRQGHDEVYLYRPHSTILQPYTFVSPAGEAKFDYVAPLAGARVAFATTARGYTAEFALPWKALQLKPDQGIIPFELQVIFSDPAGSTDAAMAWWHGKGSPGDTVEDLPSEARLYPETWGRLAAQTLSAGGGVAAGLGPGVPQAATGGEAAAKRVGDAAGVPLQLQLPRAGKLSLLIADESGWIVRELLAAQPVERGTFRVLWNGRDRYNEVLPPGNYHWKALLFDGVGSKFAASVGNSGRPPYRTADGLGSMGGQHGVPTALAADEGGVYLGSGSEEGTPALRKINGASGAALWKRSVGNFGSAPAVAAGDGLACFINITGARNGQSVDLVRIDPTTGKDLSMGASKARLTLKVTVAARIPAAAADPDDDAPAEPTPPTVTPTVGGLAIVGHRAYYSVPAENRIGGVDLESGQPLPSMAVLAPLGLARLDGDHLLVCSGTAVLKVALPGGDRVPLVTGLLAPRSVAVDRAGNLFVSDLASSQQIKKFDAQGVPLAAWGKPGGKPRTMPTYDPLAFTNVNALSLDTGGNLWVSEGSPTPKRFIKMSTAGRVLEEYFGPVAYNAFGPDLADCSDIYYNPGTNQGGTQVVRAKVDFAKYAVNPQDPAAAWKIAAIYDLAVGADGATVNPLMAQVARTGYSHYLVFSAPNGHRYLFRPSKGNRGAVPPGAGLWLLDADRFVPCAFLSRDEEKEASWTDANGDGLMQQGERFAGLPTTEFAWLGPDLTLEGFLGKLGPASTDARGVPQYQDGHFAPYLEPGQPAVPRGWTFVSQAGGGAVYYAGNLGPQRKLAFWDRASENQIIKVQNGREQWLVGNHSARPGATDLEMLSGIAGIVDDMVLAHTVEPANYVAFTTDGFTLGNVIVDESGARPSTGPNSITIESFTGLFLRDPVTTKRLLFSVSSGDDRVLEITGPGETTRLEGPIRLQSSSPRETTGTTGTTTIEIPYQGWYGNMGRGQGVDGLDYEWQPESRGVPLAKDGIMVGDVRLRRSGGVLSVLADLPGGAGPATGEGLELQLSGAEGTAPTTLFLSAGPAAKKPGTAVLARLERDGETLARTGIKVAIAPRWHDLGYRLEADIPLGLLPDLAPPRPQSFTAMDKIGKLIKQTATLPDLRGPIRLKVTLIRRRGTELERISFPLEGSATVAAPPN